MEERTGFRIILANYLFSLLQGATFGNWWRLLLQNRFSIDPPYWPRALFLTQASLVNSAMARLEEQKYGDQIDSTTIQPPLFILGHYRSGTTHLHNLLAVDLRFAYPTLLQALYPHTFLTVEAALAPLMAQLMTRQRPQDNMIHNAGSPAEDEFALCAATSLSPYLGWAFPRGPIDYGRYLTLRGVPEDELARWKATFVRFMKKLTLVAQSPLLLKSPPHTARIRILLSLFPEARFIHIHRNPYNVFRSTRHLWKVGPKTWQFQQPPDEEFDDRIINTYKTMYRAFFEERGLIPRGQWCEVSFEELERDPVRQIESIYQALRLPEFESVRPALEKHIISNAGYQKNQYAALPKALRERLSQEWRRSFDEWGYDR